MKKTILVILFFLSIISVYSQGNESINELYLVTIEEVAVQNFLDSYFEKIEGDEQVYSLHIRHRDEHIQEYYLLTPGYWQEGQHAPLAYTNYKSNLILLYSGIETFFPSKKRNELLLQMLKGKIQIYAESFLGLPSVDYPSGILILCDGVRVLHQEIGYFPGDDPCVVEEPSIDEEY